MRNPVRLAVLVFAALGAGAVAHAQSAADGFNPGSNGLIWTVVAQPDGKVLAGGDFTMMGGVATVARSRIARVNADGLPDSGFNPGANGTVRIIAVQPDGRILVGGQFTMLGGGGSGTTVRHNIGRLNPDGSLDTGFNPDANLSVNAIAIQPDGRIVIGGIFTTVGGTPRHGLARLNADGSLDASFNPGTDASIETMVLQPNGQIVVGGYFLHLGGGGDGTTVRNRIGRINPDGTLDASFDPGANEGVFWLDVQPDRKILVAGNFTMLGGGTRNYIGRLNADGSLDTAFDPGANDQVNAIRAQPDGRILVGGNFTMLGGGGTGTVLRHSLGRLNLDGSLDTQFNPVGSNSVVAVTVQADGKILAAGTFSTLAFATRFNIGRLYPSGALDTDFTPTANSAVTAIVAQPDGNIVVGGSFTSLDSAARTHLGRFGPDGFPDTFFNPGANNVVSALAVQPDGKIIVGGVFTTLGGGGPGINTRNHIGRLNADGSIDPTFNPGADGTVYAVALQPDGRIIVVGNFTMLGGGTRNYIGRLNADGSLDSTFDPGANGFLFTVALQADGKILVGGFFTAVGGTTGTTARAHIARLNADGSVDTGFNPGANDVVEAMVTQPDGKIVAAGSFTMLGGGGSGTTARNCIGRLNADGTLDTGFNPGANVNVFSIALQTDGRILLGGDFTTLGGGGSGTTARSRIGRINADGSLDTGFDAGANGSVYALALQADGKVLTGGSFSTLGGGGSGVSPRSNLGRLSNSGAAQNLSVLAGGTLVRWTRGLSSPEVSRVTFDLSTDGTSYTPLGSASRTAGGWQLGGVVLPANQNIFIRARGYYTGGYLNTSGSIVESIRNAVTVPCTYTLSPSSASVPSGINTGSVMLTTNDATCPWTAPNSAFITVTTDSAGTGTTVVRWVTSINPGTSPRMGVLTIAGLRFTITQAGASTTRRVPNDFNHDAISDIAVFRPGIGRFFVVGQPNTDWGIAGDLPVPGDYNGDGNPEVAVFRPSNGTWYVNGGATVVWGRAGDIPVPGDYNGDHVTDMAVFRPSAGQWLVRGIGTFTWGLDGDLPVAADFDGDGVTDIAVYRPSTGTWYVRGGVTTVWGVAPDIPVPADYNGDDIADIAVFRPTTGVWYIKDQYTETWGAAGDVPVAMDRSGDGIAELGVFRRATGTWYFKNHVTDGNELVVWGASGDIPLGRAMPPVTTLAGDFDGDRKADLTVFRPSTGDWISLRSLSGFTDYTTHTWGLSSDTLVARDYDGDGRIDPAVFRSSIGRWLVLRSSTNYSDSLVQDWGVSGDLPVPGDYDGDGKADMAVFRPSAGRWFILLSSTGGTSYIAQDFGLSGDIPAPADFDGDGRTDIAVFRPSSGRWYVYDRNTDTTAFFDWGFGGDVPAPADFDGDGRADLAVFRPGAGRWFIKSSIDGSYIVADWGIAGDVPVPADFDADGKADIAVFRPSTGFWYVLGLFNRSWGAPGDMAGIKIP